MRAQKNTVPAKNRKTVAYVRVSTQDQAAEGVSLDVQGARIAAYCAAMGFEVSETVRDAGESASTLQRPGMAKVLANVRAGNIDRVVVLKLDRLTRSTRDLAEVLDVFGKSDAALVSVSESLDTASACGRMIIGIIGVVAQWEREAIAERTASALAHKRQHGQVYCRHAPFGYKRQGSKLIADPVEQSAFATIRRMHNEGATYRQIAAWLTKNGVQPKGRAWYAASVRGVLRSKMATEAVA